MIISSILRNPISNPISAVLGGGARNPWGTLVEDLDIRLSMVAGQTGQYKNIDGSGGAPTTGDPVGYIKSAHDPSAGHMAATGTSLRPILQSSGSWAYDGVDDTMVLNNVDKATLTEATAIMVVGQIDEAASDGMLFTNGSDKYVGIWQRYPSNTQLYNVGTLYQYEIDGIAVTTRDHAYNLMRGVGDHVIVIRCNFSSFSSIQLSGYNNTYWAAKLNVKKFFLMADTPSTDQIDQLLAVEL